MKFTTTTYASAKDKKLARNLGIGLLSGGAAEVIGTTIIGTSLDLPGIVVAALYTVGASSIVAGSVLLGLGLAAKVQK